MSLSRAFVAGLLACAVAAPPAWAKGHKNDDDNGDDDDGKDDKPAKPTKPAKKSKADKAKAAKADKGDDDDSDDKPAKPSKGAKGDKGDKADKDDDDSDDKPTKPSKDDKSDQDSGDDDTTSDDSSGDDKPHKAKPVEEPLIKQDLNGHDIGGKRSANEFERDRFFVDKTDTKKTEKTTLIQGSLTSTSFLYTELGDKLAPVVAGMTPTGVTSNAPFSRLFTDLRVQTDFRHIGGGIWDGRIDVRGRFVDTPDNNTPSLSTTDPGVSDKVQSGAYGDNELDLRELWLIRNGERTDVTIGRQFITDLASVKIDGVRADYASSTKLTYLGFGGLYPLRGSRSIFTDYQTQYGNPDPTSGIRPEISKFTGAAGGGAAYRTSNAYGAVGGVALVPLAGEDPRVFVTSNGYLRSGSTLDFYHFAVIDLASGAGLTNLSAGINYKPDPRLRVTVNFNHVDTETLNVQASQFLNNPDVSSATNPGTGTSSAAMGTSIVQNEAYLSRISTNEARAGLSAGLGPLQRYQVTVTAAYRYRPDITLTPPGTNPVAGTTIDLKAAQSVEIYAGFTDRHAFADLRLGFDASYVAGIGDATFYRTTSTSARVFAGRELRNGHGEWEAEVDYLSTKDDDAGKVCGLDPSTCFGAANATILSLGGTLYYRINRDWFAIGSLFLNHESLDEVTMAASTSDPAVTGITAFGRVAYRF